MPYTCGKSVVVLYINEDTSVLNRMTN
jgi:hypothetical protein